MKVKISSHAFWWSIHVGGLYMLIEIRSLTKGKWYRSVDKLLCGWNVRQRLSPAVKRDQQPAPFTILFYVPSQLLHLRFNFDIYCTFFYCVEGGKGGGEGCWYISQHGKKKFQYSSVLKQATSLFICITVCSQNNVCRIPFLRDRISFSMYYPPICMNLRYHIAFISPSISIQNQTSRARF